MNEIEGHFPVEVERLDKDIKRTKRLILAGYSLASVSILTLGAGVANLAIENYEVATLDFGISAFMVAGSTYGIITNRRTLETLNKTKALLTDANHPNHQ